ncbi:MAG TPA: hypothetical protein VG318_00470 [Actinomycetota bacterium]|nr:hypothetical protein [Actinomycetota bacterium]
MVEIVIVSVVAGLLAYALVRLTWDRARRYFARTPPAPVDPPPLAPEDAVEEEGRGDPEQ